MVDVLNMTKYLSYTDSLSFPTIPNLGTAYDLSPLYALNATVSKMTVQSYGYNQNYLNQLFANLNALTAPKSYNEGNLVNYTATGNATQKAQEDLYVATIKTYISARTAAQNQISYMQTSTKQLLVTANTMKQQALRFESDYTTIGNLVTPMITDGQNFYELAYCGNIGDDYKTFKSTWCDTLGTALAFLALANFIIAMCCIAVVIMSIVLEKRINHGQKEAGAMSQNQTRTASPSGHSTKSHQQEGETELSTM